MVIRERVDFPLDTHAFLWAITGDKKLSKTARKTLQGFF
jgi:PIN domain nuclease of toxin-antitoxin system